MRLVINDEKCIKCGLCEADCPARAITHDDGRYWIRPEYCIECSHCACICPKSAVESDAGFFPDWEDPNLQPDVVERFLAGTRSIRQYKPDSIPDDVLNKFLHVGSLTATASNMQDWYVTILRGDAITYVKDKCMGFFATLAKWARKSWVQKLVKLVPAGRRLLEDPHAIDKLVAFVDAWKVGGDPLFFAAPVVVILHSEEANMFGRTNNVLAGAAMQYFAQSFGIGSCMIGFAEQFLSRSKKIRKRLGIPKSQRVDLVFTLGYSKAKYKRLPIRKEIPCNEVTQVKKK